MCAAYFFTSNKWQTNFIELGLIPTLISLLHNKNLVDPACMRIHGTCYEILQHLSSTDDIKSQMISLGLGRFILDYLRFVPIETEVQIYISGFSLILNVYNGPSNVKAMVWLHIHREFFAWKILFVVDIIRTI